MRSSTKRYFIMRFLLPLIFLLISATGFTQIGTGQWRMHVPSRIAIDIAAGNGKVMVALQTGVVEYDIAAAENRLLNELNALSDINVSCITYEPATQSFFVGYENGNLDQVNSGGSVINIPAIKLSGVSSNKRINKMVASNDLLYITTGFGIVVLDPVRQEVRETWFPSNGLIAITDVAFRADSVYALTNEKLFRGLANSLFLSDAAQWQTDPRLPTIAGVEYKDLAVKDNEVYYVRSSLAYAGDSVMKLTPTGTVGFITQQQTSFDMQIDRFEIRDGLFYLYFPDALVAFNDNFSVNFGVDGYGSIEPQPARVVVYENRIWVADKAQGLVRYQNPQSYTYILHEGPPKNDFFSLAGQDDKIVVTGGSPDRVVPSYNTSGIYTFKDEAWTLYDRTTQTNWSDNIWDIGAVAINKDNPERMAVASYSKDAVAIVEGNQIIQYYNAFNSGLDSTNFGGESSNGSVCISDLEYDEDGNLWFLNCYTGSPLKVLTAAGQWQEFNTGTLPNFKFTYKLVIDQNGNKWFGTNGAGLIGYNDNGTPAITSDDDFVNLLDGEGVGNLPNRNVTALAVDLDNEIWIGTEAGFVILYNSAGIFSSSSIDASPILIDFEGNIEDLLGGTFITDIEIDGGNRKWIGTENSGIFLLSASGQEVISNFTKENSPLLSNKIMDMKFNTQNGELFIVTDEGLVSYRADASEGALTYDSTVVFPNPVRPEYFGPITIQGIKYDSDVKITDISGNLVYKTTSNGGTAVWNGKNLDGSEVASGVYLIWTATKTEKNRKVGKVVVIR